jgi:hypothetical protein
MTMIHFGTSFLNTPKTTDKRFPLSNVIGKDKTLDPILELLISLKEASFSKHAHSLTSSSGSEEAYNDATTFSLHDPSASDDPHAIFRVNISAYLQGLSEALQNTHAPFKALVEKLKADLGILSNYMGADAAGEWMVKKAGELPEAEKPLYERALKRLFPSIAPPEVSAEAKELEAVSSSPVAEAETDSPDVETILDEIYRGIRGRMRLGEDYSLPIFRVSTETSAARLDSSPAALINELARHASFSHLLVLSKGSERVQAAIVSSLHQFVSGFASRIDKIPLPSSYSLDLPKTELHTSEFFAKRCLNRIVANLIEAAPLGFAQKLCTLLPEVDFDQQTILRLIAKAQNSQEESISERLALLEALKSALPQKAPKAYSGDVPWTTLSGLMNTVLTSLQQ